MAKVTDLLVRVDVDASPALAGLDHLRARMVDAEVNSLVSNDEVID